MPPEDLPAVAPFPDLAAGPAAAEHALDEAPSMLSPAQREEFAVLAESFAPPPPPPLMASPAPVMPVMGGDFLLSQPAPSPTPARPTPSAPAAPAAPAVAATPAADAGDLSFPSPSLAPLAASPAPGTAAASGEDAETDPEHPAFSLGNLAARLAASRELPEDTTEAEPVANVKEPAPLPLPAAPSAPAEPASPAKPAVPAAPAALPLLADDATAPADDEPDAPDWLGVAALLAPSLPDPDTSKSAPAPVEKTAAAKPSAAASPLPAHRAAPVSPDLLPVPEGDAPSFFRVSENPPPFMPVSVEADAAAPSSPSAPEITLTPPAAAPVAIAARFPDPEKPQPATAALTDSEASATTRNRLPQAPAAAEPVRQETDNAGSLGLIVGGAMVLVVGLFFAAHGALAWMDAAAAAVSSRPDAAVEGALARGTAVLAAAAAALLMVLGAGSVAHKRWAPPLLHALGWVVVLFTLTYAGSAAAAVFYLSGDAASALPVLPDKVQTQLVIAALAGIAIPLVAIAVWQRPEAAAACAAVSPRRCWTDARPIPVLMTFVTALAVVAVAAAALVMACRFPAFGAYADTDGSRAAWWAFGILGGLAAAFSAMQRKPGWWLLLAGTLAIGSALALTFHRLDPAGLLTDAAPGSGSPGTAIAGAVLALPALLVLAMTRKAFDLHPHPVDNA